MSKNHKIVFTFNLHAACCLLTICRFKNCSSYRVGFVELGFDFLLNLRFRNHGAYLKDFIVFPFNPSVSVGNLDLFAGRKKIIF